MAISQQFITQINGTNQAINNANDAVSETQTAAGALTTIVNNLQSIRTLAVESANGSNSAADRQALDQQVQQQIAEITDIAPQTSFNGLQVLNGSSGVQTYQVGANVGNTISVNLAQGVGANQVGAVASTTTAVARGGTSGALTIAVGMARRRPSARATCMRRRPAPARAAAPMRIGRELGLRKGRRHQRRQYLGIDGHRQQCPGRDLRRNVTVGTGGDSWGSTGRPC